MRHRFLIDTFETEIQKVLSVWSMFNDADLSARPHSTDARGRNLRELMVHQCVSEDFWFKSMLGIAVTDDPLPAEETRVGFLRCYAANAALRLEALRARPDAWWEEESQFFEVRRIYTYRDVEALLREEAGERNKQPLPEPGETPLTERPDGLG